MKCENKNKKKGKRVLPVFRERNLAKGKIKNDKNLRWSQVWIKEREKTWKTFEKVFLKKSRFMFLKNLIHDVRLIEKQVRSIEPDRGLHKFLNKISIDRKTNWINWKSGKTFFLKKITLFLKTHLKALKKEIKMH